MKRLLILVTLILFLLLFLSVKFDINYTYSNGSSSLNISTSYLYGLFKPEINPFNKEKKIKNRASNNFNLVKASIKDIKYRRLIYYIWDKSVLEKIIWETKIGFIDAFLVGIIYGVVWNFKSILVSFLLANKKANYIDINVIPIFNENQLDIAFNCIIKIRMVYIIIVWMRFLKLYKGGERNDRSSNRRFNENYNE